jgi:hypothetical protein
MAMKVNGGAGGSRGDKEIGGFKDASYIFTLFVPCSGRHLHLQSQHLHNTINSLMV